ncbi:MAG: hypothetical protein AAB691_00955 [Patescibacteria group bacterium]
MSKMETWFGEHKRELILGLIIFLVATTSFAFGYLLAKRDGRAPIVVEQKMVGP